MNPVRSRFPIIGMVLSAVLIAGVQFAASPLEAQRPSVRKPGVKVQAPCCSITAIDARARLVTAKDANTGKSFQFRVTDRRLLGSLKVGQNVYADQAAKKAGIAPGEPCCEIVATTAAGGMAAAASEFGIVNVLRPSAEVVGYDAETRTLTARDLSSQRLFTIRLGTSGSQGGLVAQGSAASSGKTYRRGQIISTDLRGSFAAATGFPIDAVQENEIGASSRKMKTNITLSANGRIDGTTRTWTSEALRGFTGAVEVVVTDISGNVLHRTQVRSYGVNGTASTGESDRTERWTEQVPEDVLNSAAAVVIGHHHDPKNRIPGAVSWIVKNWECGWAIYQALTGGEEESGFGPVDQSDQEKMEQAKDLMKACEKVFG
jgi:hypothetical protein